MKKLIGIAACLIIMMTANTAHSNEYLKLHTTGTVISNPIRNTTQGCDNTTGSILVDIQGFKYAIDDTKYNKIKYLKPGDQVTITMCLDEQDTLAKAYIIEKL